MLSGISFVWIQWRALIFLAVIFLVACGNTANPTASPTTVSTAVPSSTEETATSMPSPTAAATTAISTTPTPTVVQTAAAPPGGIVSARDDVTLVVGGEPAHVNPFLSGTGIPDSSFRDNVVDPLTWQSWDDQRIVPTSASTDWQQMDPNRWRFTLRQGVKFQDGEDWNADAALPSLAFQGLSSNGNYSFNYTGGYTAEKVDDYTLDIVCDQACPIFPNTSMFLNFVAPNFLATTTEDQQALNTVSFGPYKIVKWDPGVSITEEAYDGYVPAGDHFEFQKPYIKNLTWIWRGEPTVAGATVKTGEADIAWDIGIDVAQSLPKEMVRAGGSAEVYAIDVNTLWNPELKKVKVRQAMAHAINCQELIDSLYSGHSVCRGNIIWPGVIGATEENTAAYTYDPDLSRQLLQDANYDPSTVFTFAGRADRFPKQVEVREAIQAYLKDVGINVKIETVENATNRNLRNCRSGAAVNDVLQNSGRTPGKDKPTFDDYKAALALGGSSCPSVDLQENFPSNETLDFGRQANYYLNCEQIASPHCDPSPGGFQEMLPNALAASGEERQKLMQAMADRVHDEVLWLAEFDTPVFYAVNPKLNWTPRFDRRVRASTMWFSP